ncbi:MAG: O-antigen ligase family protein [Candidatus Electryonea clarkiae]|nr:O-antigen ligase family protein [Candidatus Electryonea clarkiae]MDP8287723.1 O-antigen ligase family protein [Candidatus Electryonea clarkiae]
MTAIGAYLKRTGGEPIAPVFAVLIIGIISLLVLVAVFNQVQNAIIGACLLLFLFLFGWRIETLPVLFLAYIALTPTVYIPEAFRFFKIPYYPYLAPVLLFGMVVIFKLDSTVNFLSDKIDTYKNQEKTETDLVGIFVLLFLVWMVFQSIRGIALGNNPYAVRFEVMHTINIAGYFIWKTLFKRRPNIKAWLIVLVLIELATAMQYFSLIIVNWENIVNFVLMRIITRQGHMTLAAIPLTMAFAFSATTKKHRIIWALVLVVILAHVIFTQQRALFLATAVTFISMFTLYAFRDGWNKRGLAIWSSGMLALTILFAAAVYWALGAFNVDIEVLFSRWQQFGTLQDASTMMRIYDIKNALNHFFTSPILGLGIGKELLTIPNGMLFIYIDNSYIITLFKGGFVYLLLLLAIYMGGAWHSWQVYRKSNNTSTKMIGAGILSALIGIIFTGSTNVCMIYYRFTYVWMMLIAAAVILNRSLNEQKVEKSDD